MIRHLALRAGIIATSRPPLSIPPPLNNAYNVSCRAVSSFSPSDAQTPPPQAALMIIGNEILNGSITDANTPWLAKLLNARGVDLTRVVCIPDDEEEIGATCLDLQRRVGPNGFVFTSGGIGPTHDDVTYQALAAAFGLELTKHEPTVKLMQEHYDKRGIELNEARLRMATLPTPAEVLYTPGLWVPLVIASSNVYILPGIPRLFSAMVEASADRFKGPASYSDVIYTSLGEGDVADPLAAVASQFPTVRIGSYPRTSIEKGQYTVKLQFESRDEAAVKQAVEAVEAVMPTFKL